MNAAKKITLYVPEDLLQLAQQSSGLNLSATVRKGLELVAAAPAYENIRKMRGKFNFSIDLKELRKD